MVRKPSYAAIFVSCALAATACRRAAPPPAPSAAVAVPVATTKVRVQAVPRSIRVVGTLYGDEEIALAAKVAGRIAAVMHDAGDVVAAGTVLAQVERDDYELAVAQREAALQAALAELGLTLPPAADFDPDTVPAVARARVEAANAEARWTRGEAMFAEQPPLISAEERADLRTAMESARAAQAAAVADARAKVALAAVRAAELAQARKAVDDTAVAAPAGGPWRVGRRHVGAGDYVLAGLALFDLVDSDPIEFRADVPERWSAAVQKGQKATVTVPARAEPLVGEVVRLWPMADARKRTFTAGITLANPDGALLPGGFARGAIATHVDPAVVFVPQDAVVVALGVSKVFTIVGGKAVEHVVTTAARDGAWLEVAAGGLAAGDEVVTSGAARLANGVAVVLAAAAGDGK